MERRVKLNGPFMTFINILTLAWVDDSCTILAILSIPYNGI